ncbi:MAG: HAD family hydrolase [Acidobacteriota bacterium]|nr:HAD family hydrolase [Acidobacteriota bacterium]
MRAVIMDVDGTLYRQGPVRRYVAIRLLRYSLLHPVKGWKTVRALAAYRRAQEHLRAAGDGDGARRQTGQAAHQTGYTTAFIGECVERWMNCVPLDSLKAARPPDLIPFLDWACGEGLRLAVVSDYEVGNKLRVLGIDGYFPVAVCAQDEEVGFFKPNPRALEVALQRLNLTPGEAIYVGDRPEVDGAAAVAAGIPGVIISHRAVKPVPGVVTINSWMELRSLIGARREKHSI